MRREVTSHIRQAASALNTDGCADDELITGDIGCLANRVAAIARMCKIPDSEVLHEGVGQATGAYRRRSSCLPDIEVCTAFGPTYMKQTQHRHWYHVGQNHHHTAAMLQSKTSSQQQQQIAHAQRQLQQQLLLKAQQGTLTPSRAADELLQSYSSNTHSDKASSWGSEPGGLHALPPLQPMASSSSSSAAAPLSGSSSSSEEDLPGFQAEFDSDSAACTPTYSGDEACLGMLLGTNFGL